MEICVLTELQAAHLEHKGIIPECSHWNPTRRRMGLSETDRNGGHAHIPYKEAKAKVGNDLGDREARWIGGFFAICFNTKRGWNSKRSGSVRTMQMTRETSGYRPHA
jgi:hypothetical protein